MKKMVKCTVDILGFSKLGQLLILSFTLKLVRLQLLSSSMSSVMVLFCSSHFPHPHLLLSLSKLNSPSLYTLIYLKNGFSHSLFNPLYSLQTLSIGPLFMFSLIFFQNKNPHLLLQFCFLHTQNTQFAFIFSNSHFSLFPSLLTSS